MQIGGRVFFIRNCFVVRGELAAIDGGLATIKLDKHINGFRQARIPAHLVREDSRKKVELCDKQ